MTSSIAHLPFGSIPYSQHHAQNPDPFTEVSRQTHTFTSFDNIARSSIILQADNLGAIVGTTRLWNINETSITGSGAISAEQLLSGRLTSVAFGGVSTITLPPAAELLPAFKTKYGSLKAGMTVPFFFTNLSGFAVTFSNPPAETVMTGLANPSVFPTTKTQFAFIRIPTDGATTYEYINTKVST